MGTLSDFMWSVWDNWISKELITAKCDNYISYIAFNCMYGGEKKNVKYFGIESEMEEI